MVTLQFFPRKGSNGQGSFGFIDASGALVSINPICRPFYYQNREEALLEAQGRGFYVNEDNYLIAQA
jgi:hypothetical protein